MAIKMQLRIFGQDVVAEEVVGTETLVAAVNAATHRVVIQAIALGHVALDYATMTLKLIIIIMV